MPKKNKTLKLIPLKQNQYMAQGNSLAPLKKWLPLQVKTHSLLP
jgi:hypothetical protein